MAIYDQIFLYVNGALLVENTSLEIDHTGENQAVLTTALGYDGESPSPKMTTMNIEGVHPPTGFTFDPVKAFNETTEIEVKAQSGATGKSLVSKGFVQPVKTASGVGKVTTTSWGFRGKPANFE